MKKLLSFGLILFLAFTMQAQETPAENTNAPDFTFETETYNFGTITQGEKVTYEFKFENTGKEPLIITRAKGSCGCTVPVWPKEPIKAGEKSAIKVVFNSKGKMGKQRKTITINSNAKTPAKRIFITGNIIAKVTEQSNTSPEKKIDGAVPVEKN